MSSQYDPEVAYEMLVLKGRDLLAREAAISRGEICADDRTTEYDKLIAAIPGLLWSLACHVLDRYNVRQRHL